LLVGNIGIESKNKEREKNDPDISGIVRMVSSVFCNCYRSKNAENVRKIRALNIARTFIFRFFSDVYQRTVEGVKIVKGKLISVRE